MKIVMNAIAIALCTVVAVQNSIAVDKVPTIGIVVPLEHQAMTEIVAGFQETLSKEYPYPVEVVVKNAQHDPLLEQSIIHQMLDNQVSVIEPIGEDAFQMALSDSVHTPVIGIAASFPSSLRKRMKDRAVNAVDDEVSSKPSLRLIKALYPDMKVITLVHSEDNKIFADVAKFKVQAKAVNLKVQDLAVPTMQDLYTLSQHISPQSGGIFILKDHLIVSAIPILVRMAEHRHIPVIASDDGSVEGGAAFAVGVRERQIGVLAAEMTVRFLKGQPLQKMPVSVMTTLHLFVNPKSANSQNVNLRRLGQVATQLRLKEVLVNQNGKFS